MDPNFCTAAQRQTAVSAYLRGKQLLLFAFAMQWADPDTTPPLPPGDAHVPPMSLPARADWTVTPGDLNGHFDGRGEQACQRLG